MSSLEGQCGKDIGDAQNVLTFHVNSGADRSSYMHQVIGHVHNHAER